MTRDDVVTLVVSAMETATKVALPLLAAGLIVGLLVSIFQAITQIQEMTLAFIPKIIAVGVVLVVMGPWMLGQIVGYTEQLYGGIPGLVGP